MSVQRLSCLLEGNQRANIEPRWIGQCSTSVARRDKEGAFLGKKARRVFADSAEPLHGDPRSFQVEADKFACHIDAGGEAEARCADLIERNSAESAGQTDGSADFVLDPGHALLVRAHVRPGDVVGDIANGAGKGADHLLLR